MLTESFESKIEKVFFDKEIINSQALILTGLDSSDWIQLAKKIFLLVDKNCSDPSIDSIKENSDVVWIENEKKKKTIVINQIREALQKISLSKQRLRCRLVFIPRADLMNINSQNALLKALEEPPKACFFLLGVSFKNQLLPTIVSRCQHLENRQSNHQTTSSINNGSDREEINIWSEEDPVKIDSIKKNFSHWRELKEFYLEALNQETAEIYKKIDKLFKDQPQKASDFIRLVILEEKNKLRKNILNRDLNRLEDRLALIKDFFEIFRQLESISKSPSLKATIQIIVIGLKTLA